jgi:hypothetical protein
MPSFQLLGKFDLKNNIAQKESITQVIKILENSLRKHYDDSKINKFDSYISINGPFKPWYCYSVTKANIKLTCQNNQILYRVDGTCKLSPLTYIWLILGLIPVILTQFIFLPLFIADILEFLYNKNNPQKKIEEALKAAEFELKNYSDNTRSQNFSEENIWSFVFDEYESNRRNRELFAKCFAESNGDELNTKANYIKIRVKELSEDKTSKV